ncbi:MAG: TonB-dependent receptor [Bdellovibrionia bacterium]
MRSKGLKSASCCILVSLLYLTSNVQAEENPLQELADLSIEKLMDVKVVTSSRQLEPIDEAPNTMYVFTEKQIKLHGYHTLKELLRTVPGFGVFHKDIQYTAQVRGIAPNDNQKVAILINGHNIANVSEPDFLNGPIDLGIADRVEIIVGPGSVLYGTYSLLATINIITKSAKKGNEVQIALGNQTNEGTAVVGTEIGPSSSLIATGTAMSKEGWDAWAPGAHNPDLAGTTNTGKLAPSYFLTTQANMGDWQILGYSLNNTFPDLKHAMAPSSGVDGSRYEHVDSIVIRNQKEWNKELSTKFELCYDNKRNVRVTTKAVDPAAQGENSYDNAQFTYNIEAALVWKSGNNNMQIGIQGRADQNRNNYVFSWSPDNPVCGDTSNPICGGNKYNFIDPLTQNKDTYALGIYMQNEFRLNSKWKVVAAGRVDKNEMLGFRNTYFSPRLAVIYSPFSAWTSKLMFNKSTRTPDIFGSQLNSYFGAGNPVSPPWAAINYLVSKPETLSTLEWQNILRIDNTRLAVTFYYQQLEDFISWGGPFTNVGNFKGYGSEIEAKTILRSDLSLWENFSYTSTHFKLDVQNTSFGNVPASSSGNMAAAPQIMANAGVEWEPTEKLLIDPSFRYFTLQPTYFTESGSWDFTRNRYYLDLTITKSEFLTKSFDLSIQIFNLLNNTDTVASQYTQTKYSELGREITLQGTCRF